MLCWASILSGFYSRGLRERWKETSAFFWLIWYDLIDLKPPSPLLPPYIQHTHTHAYALYIHFIHSGASGIFTLFYLFSVYCWLALLPSHIKLSALCFLLNHYIPPFRAVRRHVFAMILFFCHQFFEYWWLNLMFIPLSSLSNFLNVLYFLFSFSCLCLRSWWFC